MAKYSIRFLIVALSFNIVSCIVGDGAARLKGEILVSNGIELKKCYLEIYLKKNDRLIYRFENEGLFDNNFTIDPSYKEYYFIVRCVGCSSTYKSKIYKMGGSKYIKEPIDLGLIILEKWSLWFANIKSGRIEEFKGDGVSDNENSAGGFAEIEFLQTLNLWIFVIGFGVENGEPLWSPGRPTTPSDGDIYFPSKCSEIEPDNECIERCIIGHLIKQRRQYGYPSYGEDCKEFSRRIVRECRQRCNWVNVQL